MSENPPPDELQTQLQEFRACFEQLKNEGQKVVIGQEEIIEKTVIAMVAGGHVLLEGVPGLGKTLLVRSLAGALRLTFQRIQFTPDLMPADLIGTKILVDDGHGHSRFEFAPGPVFCNLLLGDEINRATPKTQSALLEAMQEQSVTVGGETRHLKKPFFVLATQNPLEMEGTYPLPEAQLDRFFFKITVNYPSAEAFDRILDLTTARDLPTVEPVFDGARLVEMGALARDVPVAPTIRQRVVRLIMATHPETDHAIDAVKRYVRYGASPRAGQACLLAAKIRAILQGRFHVAGEDILSVALPVLRHRVMMSFEAQADGVTSDALIEQIFEAEKKEWTA
jgi:MoxR-like ATPase